MACSNAKMSSIFVELVMPGNHDSIWVDVRPISAQFVSTAMTDITCSTGSQMPRPDVLHARGRRVSRHNWYAPTRICTRLATSAHIGARGKAALKKHT